MEEFKSEALRKKSSVLEELEIEKIKEKSAQQSHQVLEEEGKNLDFKVMNIQSKEKYK